MNGARWGNLARLVAGLALLLLVGGCGQGVAPDERVERARDHRAEGDHRAAIIELRNALQEQSDHAAARALLGRIYVEVEEMAAAEKELRRALDLGVPRAELVVPLGVALYHEDENERLLEEIQAETSWPATVRADVHGLRARAHTAANELAAAQRELERADSAASGALQADLARIELAQARERPDKAAAHAEAATERHPDSPAVWRVAARSAAARGDSELAKAAATRAIDLAPQPAADHLLRARLRVESGEIEGAQEDLNALSNGLKDNPRVRFVDALVAWREENYDTACDQFQAAVSDAPEFVEARYFLGACLYRAGAFNQAESHLNWVGQRTADPRVARMLAVVRLALGQTDRAREALRPVIAQHPDDAMLWALLGRIEMQAGNTTEAIGYLQRLAELRPDDPTARLELGTGLLRTGQIEAGQQALDEALQLDPDSERAGAMLVISHLQDGEHEKALAAARRMSQQRPDAALPWTLTALVYLAQEDRASAREALDRAVEREPADPAARHYLARIEMQAGDPAAAKAHYEAVLEDDPGHVRTLVALASLESRNGNTAEARDLLERAHEADPNALRPRVLLARQRMEQDEPRAALEILTDDDGSMPNEPAALEIAGRAHLALGRSARAINALSRLVEQAPRSAEAHLLLTRAYAQANDGEAAVKQIEEVLEFDSENTQALMLLARVRTQQGRDEEARSVIERLSEEARDSPYVLRTRAMLALRAGEAEQSVELYRQLLDADPSGRTAVGLARVLARTGDSEEAVAVLEDWTGENAGDTTVLLALGDLYIRMDRDREAITAYRKALESAPESVQALNNLAWLLREQAPEKAVGHAERAVELQPDSAAVRDTYGMVLLANDRPEEAVQQLRTAVELAPEAPSLRYNYGRGLAAAGREAEAREQLRLALESEAEFDGRDEAEALLADLENKSS